MHYEGTITIDEEELRQPLFEALRNKDEQAIEALVADPTLAQIIAMDHDGEAPVLGNARRLLRKAKGEALLKVRVAEEFAPKWNKLVRDLTSLLSHPDEETLAQYYRSQPWTALREEYAKTLVCDVTQLTDDWQELTVNR